MEGSQYGSGQDVGRARCGQAVDSQDGMDLDHNEKSVGFVRVAFFFFFLSEHYSKENNNYERE